MEKKQSKLYTEEQVRKAWNTAYVDALSLDNEDYKPIFYDDFIASLTPIELPTDEEIGDEAMECEWGVHPFKLGAKWMRDKIKGDGDE